MPKSIDPVKYVRKNFKQIVVWTMILIFLGTLIPTTFVSFFLSQ